MESPMAHLVTQRTRKDGSLVDVDIVGGPVTVGGELVAKHVFYHDISELQEQKRYFQSLLEVSPTAIVITDLDWKPDRGTPPPRGSSGTRRRRPLAARPTTSLRHGRTFTTRRGSTRRPQHAASGSRPSPSGPGRTVSFVDVEVLIVPVDLRRRQAADRLQHHLSRHQRAPGTEAVLPVARQDQDQAAIVVTDLEARVVSWNPGAQRLFGYTAAEAVGPQDNDMVATPAGYPPEAVGYTEAARRGERAQVITRRTRKDGSWSTSSSSAPVVVGEERVGHVSSTTTSARSSASGCITRRWFSRAPWRSHY